MSREQRIGQIQALSQRPDAFDSLEQLLAALPRPQLSDELLDCGIIPERYQHDSSAEKLWAKYCDILLSHTLISLGHDSQVIRARGDAADVLAKTAAYSVVGDAKAFRLSRTAKNQKDFKVSSLDDWRRSNTFACLIGPLYQFPARRSQIYAQAEAKNVTLLSYVHLKFLLDHPPAGSLVSLWETPATLTPGKEARRYWDAIDEAVLALTKQSTEQLRQYKAQESSRVAALADEGVLYWKAIITSYHQLSQAEAVTRLIQAEKIDQKISTIRKTASAVKQNYNE